MNTQPEDERLVRFSIVFFECAEGAESYVAGLLINASLKGSFEMIIFGDH